MVAVMFGHIKNLPKELYHDPTLKDINGWTVAMYAAASGCIKYLPKELYHDPTLKNNRG